MAATPKKITIPFLPNEVGDIIMANSHLVFDDYVKLCRIKPFHESANMKMYKNVTITAPSKGLINVKHLCMFLRTIIENPNLANYVQSLEVRFPGAPKDIHRDPVIHRRRERDSTTLLSMRRHIMPNIDVFKTAMHRVGFVFNFEAEPNEYVIGHALVAIVLSQTSYLRSLILDYEDDDWRDMYAPSRAPAPWQRLFKNLQRLERFELRDLEGPHEVQYMNLLQSILARPSLRTFNTSASLPHLDFSHGKNHVTTMNLELTAQEVSKRDPNLNRLLQKSPALEVLQMSIPKNSVLPSDNPHDHFSPLLKPIALTLKKLTLEYVCDLWDVRRGSAWPGFLDLTSCVVLTDVKISWHYLRTHADTDVVKYFPPSLAKLQIYDIPFKATQIQNFEWTTGDKPINLFTRFRFPKPIGSNLNWEGIFLGHIQDLGSAHRSKRLPKLEKLTLEMTVLNQLLDVRSKQFVKDLAQLGLLELLKERFYPRCAAYVHELSRDQFIMLSNGLDVNACLKARLEDVERHARENR